MARSAQTITNLLNRVSKDLLLETVKQNVPGHSDQLKFGANEAVGTSYEDVSLNSGSYTWQAAEAVMSAVSDSVNDTIAGSGAQKITFVGVNAIGTWITEEVDMDGTTPVSPSVNMRTVFRGYVSQAGTYNGNNAGVITITKAGGSTELIIPIGKGQSQVGRFTVPLGYTFISTAVVFTVDSGKVADFILWQSFGGVKRVVREFFGMIETVYMPLVKSFPALTDLTMQAKVPSTSARVTSDIQGVLVEDAYINIQDI